MRLNYHFVKIHLAEIYALLRALSTCRCNLNTLLTPWSSLCKRTSCARPTHLVHCCVQRWAKPTFKPAGLNRRAWWELDVCTTRAL